MTSKKSATSKGRESNVPADAHSLRSAKSAVSLHQLQPALSMEIVGKHCSCVLIKTCQRFEIASSLSYC